MEKEVGERKLPCKSRANMARGSRPPDGGRLTFGMRRAAIGRASGRLLVVVADFLELGELIAYDALTRDESCGCHFREEHQTPDGECVRDDEKFAYVACGWKLGKPVNLEEPADPATDLAVFFVLLQQ